MWWAHIDEDAGTASGREREGHGGRTEEKHMPTYKASGSSRNGQAHVSKRLVYSAHCGLWLRRWQTSEDLRGNTSCQPLGFKCQRLQWFPESSCLWIPYASIVVPN